MAAGISRIGSSVPSFVRRFLGLGSARRAFRSASVAQLDYEYYYDCEEEEWNRPELESVQWAPSRGVQWVVIGDRGAKKNAYAERLISPWELSSAKSSTSLFVVAPYESRAGRRCRCRYLSVETQPVKLAIKPLLDEPRAI